MHRRALLAAALALAAAPALAEDKPGQAGQYIDLAPVALPIVAGGRLVNYVFVYVRINLTANANAPKLRDKEPYFRDALVRLAHRAPFTRPDDYTAIDGPRLKSQLFAASVVIAGPGAVRSIEIVSQSPRRRTGLPKPQTAVAR